MDPALRPFRPGPATLAALARLRRVRIPDRGVAPVVELVVRQPALPDVGPAVLAAPVRKRVRLPELVLVVQAELRRLGPRRRLVAADPGDPAVEVEQRAVERLELRDREVEVRVRVPEPVCDRLALEPLDRGPVAPLDLVPALVRL